MGSLYAKIDKKIIFPLSEKFYGSQILKTYRFMKKSDWFSTQELNEYQNQKLQSLIKHCHENVPYYKRLFAELNLTPDDIKTRKDLVKIPILTKEIIRENMEDLLSLDARKRKSSQHSTGGSTGTPLKFQKDIQTWNAAWASTFRAWDWYGFSVGQKIYTLSGNSLVKKTRSFSTKEFFDKFIMRNYKYSSFKMKDEDLEKHYKALMKTKPTAIRGYSSTLYTLACYIEKNHLPVPETLQLILTTGEIVLATYRQKLQKVFKVPLFDSYGAGDGGIASHECYMHEGLHITEERCIIEIVDKNDKVLPDGEVGHVITTDLDNYSFPFIRYKVGDMAYIKKELCSCGRNSRLIGEVMGRAGKLLYNKKGEAISPTMLPIMLYRDMDYHDYDNQMLYNRIDKFRINQDKNANIEILLKLKNLSEKTNDFDYIVNNYKVFFNDSNIELKFVDDIPTLASGKEDYVYSEFDYQH